MAASSRAVGGGIGVIPPSPSANERLIDVDSESDVFDMQFDGEDSPRPFSLYTVGHFINGKLQPSLTAHDGSPFGSLEVLLQRPGYLAMFMRHLYDAKGCEGTIPILFLVRVASYYHGASVLVDSKDARRQGQSIINAFLSSNSPWAMELETAKVNDLEALFKDPSLTVEEAACIFNAAAVEVAQELDGELQRYAETLKAEDDDETLQEDLARMSEYDVTQKLLTSVVPSANTSAKDCAYSVALTSMALSLGMDQKCSFLERLASVHHTRSPSTSSRASLFVRGKGKRQVHYIAGHSFVATHYNSPTFCDYCNGLLWGLGNQGYTCQLCNYNVHKQTCNRSITEQCRGEPREAAGSLFRRGSLKPSFSGSFRQGMRHSASRSSLDGDTELPGEIIGSTTGGSNRRKLATVPAVGSSTAVHSDSSCDSNTGPDWLQSGNCDITGQPSPISVTSLRRVSTGSANKDADFPSQKHIMRAHSMKACPSNSSSAKSRARHVSRDSLSGASTASASACSRSQDLSTVDGTQFLSVLDKSSQGQQPLDPDMMVDEDLIPWSCRAPEECLGDMEKQEVKRQDLIYELIHTEKTHVKKLKVLLHVFRTPLLEAEGMQKKMVLALFPGLDELVDFHVDLMRRLCDRIERGDHCRVNEVGDVIADVFSQGKSESMREAAAEWVKLRQVNLDYIKCQAAKSQGLTSLLQQCESNPICQRLKLADLTSVVMQRFTKYPLLLEGILKVTDKTARCDDHANLTKAIDLSRTILGQINHEVMQFENNCYLTELQARLDMKNMDKMVGPLAVYRNLDISSRELLHRGDLKWKQKGKMVPVDALLFGDIMLLVEHNEDKTRSTLRYREDYVPILTLKDLLPPREVASDREHKTFLLVWLSATGSRMVELAATTSDASATWRIKLADAIAAAKSGEVGLASDVYSKNIKAFLMRSPTNNTVRLATERSESTNTSLADDFEEDGRESMSSALSLIGTDIEADSTCMPSDNVPEDVFTATSPRSPSLRRRKSECGYSCKSVELSSITSCQDIAEKPDSVVTVSDSTDLLTLLADCVVRSEQLVSLASAMATESNHLSPQAPALKESQASTLSVTAEELHDRLKQALAAAKIQCGGYVPGNISTTSSGCE